MVVPRATSQLYIGDEFPPENLIDEGSVFADGVASSTVPAMHSRVEAMLRAIARLAGAMQSKAF
eukprot:6819420-Lingulodinium_polyedra.AAC.1